MDERAFLLHLALSYWSSQYGLSVDEREYDIRSIPKHDRFDLAYEIVSIREDDQYVIHLYLNIGTIDAIQHSFLGVSPDMASGTLEDEKYVLMGEVDDIHRVADGYTWGTLMFDPDRYHVLLQESGTLFTCEDGELIRLE